MKVARRCWQGGKRPHTTPPVGEPGDAGTRRWEPCPAPSTRQIAKPAIQYRSPKSGRAAAGRRTDEPTPSDIAALIVHSLRQIGIDSFKAQLAVERARPHLGELVHKARPGSPRLPGSGEPRTGVPPHPQYPLPRRSLRHLPVVGRDASSRPHDSGRPLSATLFVSCRVASSRHSL